MADQWAINRQGRRERLAAGVAAGQLIRAGFPELARLAGGAGRQAGEYLGRRARDAYDDYQRGSAKRPKYAPPERKTQPKMSKRYRTGGYYGFSQRTICEPKCAKKELKFRDNAYGGIDLSTYANVSPIQHNGTSSSLVVIPEGTAENERVGRLARIHEIDFQGYIYKDPGTTATPEVLILELWQDRQNNGGNGTTEPAYSEIYDNAVATSTTVADLPNLANAKRFKKLHTICERSLMPHVVIQPGASASTFESNKIFVSGKWKSDAVNGMPIEYSGTTGAAPEITSNNMFLVVRGTNMADTYLYLTARIRYTDGL